MGGNVEPWLYVLLLWMLRRRPWAFGVVLGVGMLHREFTAYGAAALLLMDALAAGSAPNRRSFATERARHWVLVAVAWVAVQAVARSLQPFASAWGPGTHGDDQWAPIPPDTLGSRICFAPETWSERAQLLLSDHLPRLVGGVGASLRDYGVLTGVYSGQPGLGLWVGLLTVAGLGGGSWHWWTRRRSAKPDPMPHIGGYLVLVGVISTVVYGFATCSAIRVETLRYNLLGVFIPVGAVVMGMQAWRQPAVRAAFAAAVILWCTVNSLDIVALIREHQAHPLVDYRQVLADDLVAREVTSARMLFRSAYHVTFLARERVRLAATDFSRIRAYTEEVERTQGPSIEDAACDGGTRLANGQYLCPR
jgi:hypothetical protein